jgi:hypothetical protein
VAGAAAPLPYRDAIQASFGHHDISQVRAATGGAAAKSAGELGASAFAVGDRVGFAGAPDLHTAAHEAAHVVQQRAGVQLRGGIDGGPNDPYEQHADQVADKVVRGESAEALLDAHAGAGGPPAVQRKTETPSGMVNARRYLELNAFRAGEVIAQHLLQQRLPQPHPRLEWRNEKLFYQKLLYGLSGILKFQSPHDVAQLLAPGDPYGTVDQLRPLTKAVEAPDSKDDMQGGPVGPWTWSVPVGLGIAQLVEQALIDSMYRLGPRYLATAETLASGGATVAPDDIARSHPMDRFTVGPLCQPGVLAVIAEGKPKAQPPTARRDPKRPITLAWVGRQDRRLWNWVRAAPADATAEEVSAALFQYMTPRDHETRADYYATFLTAAPPMFGIPPQWAKTFEETRDFRPAQIGGADTDPAHQIVVLGGSTQADAQALAEIGVAAPDPKARSQPHPPDEHDNLVADATAQATTLKGMLAGWKLGDAADKTLAFLARRRTDGADAAKWLPVLSAQRENLTRIGSGILQLNAAVDQMKLGKAGEQAAPLREIMRLYADATACAHLDQSCNRVILRAANAQTSLTSRGLGASLRDMDMSVDMMRSGVDASDYDRRQLSATAMRLREQGTAMQTKLMRRGGVPAEEIEDLQIRVEETALDAKLTAVDFSLRQLESAADEAGAGLAAWFASRFSGKFRGLHDATQKIRDQISDIRYEWNKAKRYADMPDDNAEVHEHANLRKAVLAAQHRFAELAKQQDINDFLREGASIVQWQQFRTACVKLAALIGVSLVGGFVGGMVARGTAGMMLGTGGAAAMENLTLGGALIARGAGLVAETAIQSAGQSLIFNDKLGTTFLENMIMNLGSAGVLKALGSKVEEAARLEEATQSLWKKGVAAGQVVIKETAALTGHAILGAAMGYVAHKIVTGKEQPPPATLEEWLMQGAGIAVGRYVGRAIEASHARQQQLKLQGHAPSKKLAVETEKLAALARRARANPQPVDAMELLARRHELLTEELKVLEDIARSPELLRQSGMSQQQLASARGALTHQLAEVHSQGFGDVPLHLAGMKELIPGALWSGTEIQVLEAIRTAHESGISIKAKEDPQGGTWHVEIEGRKLEIEVRYDGKPPTRLTPAELESRGAHAVPNARFSGLATRGDPKAKLSPEQAVERAHHAVTILEGAKPAHITIDQGGNIWVSVGAEHCLVDITVGDAMADVAQHTYTRGKKHARIKISEHARLEDVTRAVAHELAEIRGLMGDATLKVTDKPALAKGSNADKMQHHDLGRVAELEILLYELESQPSRRAEILDEIEKLVDHLGLDKTKIAADARARRMLGDPVIKGVDLMNGKKRLKVARSAMREPRSQVDRVRGNWEFDIIVDLPGRPDILLAQGHVFLDSSGRPLKGPDFTIDKSRKIDGSEVRIDIEGIPSLTDFALDEAIKAFTKDFDHPPDALPGSLGDDNKAIFQKEYAVQTANGETPDVAKQRAAAKTPFVAARARQGYTKIEFEPFTEFVDIVMGHPPRVHKVPATIQLTARKP